LGRIERLLIIRAMINIRTVLAVKELSSKERREMKVYRVEHQA
jgi:hypothetical protein